MNDLVKRFAWISVYAIAMAFLEAVVVAYIRELLHLTGRADLNSYAPMEAWREAATIVMLVAVGWLAGRNKVDRLAYGMFAFGMWDIWYYVWLKVLVDWPKTLLDWDTLFLIPFPWRGPVLSPVLIAGLICVVSVLTVVQVNRRKMPKITLFQTGIVFCGALLALYVFMATAIQLSIRGGTNSGSVQPEIFNWPVFLIALTMMAIPSLMTVRPAKKKEE
jgi:hypothetical protein